jgi:hypothetical protein
VKINITYCEQCGDGWCDENYLLGVCCGEQLKTRKETDEEEVVRERAVANILKRANSLGW